jgi:hypothetical protein
MAPSVRPGNIFIASFSNFDENFRPLKIHFEGDKLRQFWDWFKIEYRQ